MTAIASKILVVIAGLSMLLAGAAQSPQEPQKSGELANQADVETKRLRPGSTIIRRPLAVPNITNVTPARKIVAGETIRFYGSSLNVSAFRAVLENRRPVTLPLVRSTSTYIDVRVPESAITAGSKLAVSYGSGPRKVLEDDYRVFPRPKFSNLRVTDRPRIGLPTTIETTVSNFGGLEGSDVVFSSPDCWTNGQRGVRFPRTNRPTTVRFLMTFRRSSGRMSETDRLLAVSGRKCGIAASIRSAGGRIDTGLDVQLPRVARVTVSDTWDLQNFSTPSGRKFQATVAGPPGGCGPLSVGTAGSFQTGVVKWGSKLSFQLRNGIANTQCTFSTSPRLQTREGWVITEVDWNIDRDQYCYPTRTEKEQSPGAWTHNEALNPTYGPPLNPEYLDRVRVVATCVVDRSDVARNDHLFRATLNRITLVGPPRQPWRMAFR